MRGDQKLNVSLYHKALCSVPEAAEVLLYLADSGVIECLQI